MDNVLKKILLLLMSFFLLVTSIPLYSWVAAATNCPAPASYNDEAKEYIDFYNIPLKSSNGKPLSEKYLLNQAGIGERVIVYGCPSDVTDNDYDLGQYRYLGWDAEGNLYRNWRFRSDSRATLHVAKNWVKFPWDTATGRAKNIKITSLTDDPDAASWLERTVDPYKESPTFLQSYNKRKDPDWTGDTMLDYAIIQQKPTQFSPGVVQMWNIWEPDGSWWYEIFTIPAEPLLPPPSKPDLIIFGDIIAPTDAWVGDSVPIKITTKNQGKENSGAFTVGIVGTSIKSEVISNVPPGQIKTVTVNVSSTTNGIKSFKAKTDFGEAVAESNENNNTKDFKITFNKKNEPTIPIAIISHLEGDHRTEPEITIKPSVDPKLDDKLSYSPGKEVINVREWKFKNPAGKTIATKPVAKDFAAEGAYLVQLRVTNSAKKVSEWAQLTINVATLATPNPSASPTPTPAPTPKPDLKADVEFIPSSIIAGEKSSLFNHSDGLSGYTWKFSDNLKAVLSNQTDFEYYDKTYSEPGYYTAEITVTDDTGASKRDTAVLQVIDPKPVAVVSGETRVIQGRDFLYPHHLSNSYTPLADRGVTIDFTKSEMRYKKIGDVGYTNGWPAKAPMVLGEYVLEGKVYDSTGRVSEWGTLVFEDVPDMPPTVNVVAPEEVYRSNGFMLYIDAESPDGDQLDHLMIEERYDQDDDGNFDEESWTTLYDGAFKWTHPLNYGTVGKRQYRATVTEDYGQQGISPVVQTDVLNYGPEANFNVFGITQQPGQDEDSGPPITSYTPDSIFRSWTLKKPYTGGNGDKLGWKPDSTSISTKNAVMASYKLGYPDLGNGPNARSKYNLAADIEGKPSWKVGSGETVIEDIFAGNRIYTYKNFPSDGVYPFYERNAVTGALIRNLSIDTGSGNSYGYTFLGLDASENFYFGNVTGTYSAGNMTIKVFNRNGELVDTFLIPYSNSLGVNGDVNFFQISSDGNEMYIGIRQKINYVNYTSWDSQLVFYKYSLKEKMLKWEAIEPFTDYGRYNYGEIKMTLAKNGDTYFTYWKQDIYSSSDAGRNGYIVQVTPSGVRRSSALSGAPGISYATLSDDGTYVYVNTVNLDWDRKLGYPFFHVLRSSDLQRTTSYTLLGMRDDWGLDRNEYGGMIPPLVLSNGNVYVTNRLNSFTQYIFSKEGSKLQETSGSDRANLTKSFVVSNGDIIHPYISNNVGATLYNFTKSKVIANVAPIVTPGLVTEVGYGTSTPILPNGSFFAFHNGGIGNYVMPFVSAGATNDTLKAIDQNTIEITNDNWGGLFYDAGSIMKNYALEFNVSVNQIENSKAIGAAFHIQDEKNMYAVEWSKDTLTLFKVVNGVKTSLQSVALARSAFTTYPVKVEAVNGTLRVYVNHSKLIEAADGTFAKGSAGLLALGQPAVSFSGVKKMNYGDTYTQETYETVLVNEQITYEKLFKDIENDPMGAEEWSYSHNPNFFENPEGFSAYHGQTLGSTVNALEKAGVYEISFRAQDNTGLSAYNKWSEPVKKLLYVHRRPLAQPDVRFTGKVFAEGEALDYETFDTSYDPDIAHILSDKVFRTRWADESTWTAGKRTYYNRPGVELIVQEQVRDIHGAWSYWGQYIVYKDALPPVNQTKPVMTITSPAGTTSAAPTVLSKEPKITWSYFDAEGDPQESYRLTMTYVDNNETALHLELEGNDHNYQMLADTINPGRVVKVQGQVYSAGVWSDFSNIRYFVLDLPPTTYLLSYNGPDGENPIYTNSNRPQLRVFTVDPENHPITAIDYEVFQALNGANVVDTNSATAAASYTTVALAEGLHYWRAKANDSYLWGPYSSNGFFFVDTVKPYDVDEQLDIEPTSVTVTFNAFDDAAPSSGHATRTFFMQRVNADGSVTNIDLNGDGSSEYSLPLALSKQSYTVTGLLPGQEYRLTVLDHDVAGNEGQYSYIYFNTNRPPVAKFDYLPKPPYEGDVITLNNLSEDPDGDEMKYTWKITGPNGYNKVFTSKDVVLPHEVTDNHPGDYKVVLSVEDIHGLKADEDATTTIKVLDLTIQGYVKHTERYDEFRLAYNKIVSGNVNSPRTPDMFVAGEAFVLEANTTNTVSSATKASQVLVVREPFDFGVLLTSKTKINWFGKMVDNTYNEKLKDGVYTFTFNGTWLNGHKESDEVIIKIKGDTRIYLDIHRQETNT